jgi:DNA polymerase I-like protein with 3'-5' exonuclease and polymerase domains
VAASERDYGDIAVSVDWQPPTELPDLRRVGLLALDTETNDEGLRADLGPGWSWGGGYIVGISVAWRVEGDIRAIYIPIRHPNSQNFDREQVIRWLRDLIASGVRIITKNGLYDWGWLWADLSIDMPSAERLEEIDALATTVDENRRKYSLDALCTWRGFPGKDEALLLEGCNALGLIPARKRRGFKPQSVLWQLPAHYVGPYAKIDAIRTLQLFENFDPILDREGTRDAYRLEVDLLPMVHMMRRRGIRIDIAAAEQARDLILAKRDAVLADLSEKLGAPVGMDEINGRNWLTATFDRLGVKFGRTEKGNPSFKGGKKGWMRQSSHWLPALIAAAHQFQQYGDNFLQAQILGHIKNGRVHGEIHPHRSDAGGARSFRFSYSHPPLQQMPKHDEMLAPLIRRVFLPEEGETWAELDYSQQEFRLLVHFAVRHRLLGATAARNQYISDPNTDIHTYTSELTKGMLQRQDAKTFNYSSIYGAGDEELARQLSKPVDEAKKLRDLYNEKMPFVPQLIERCKRAAQRDGVFKLFNGARRHFNLWAPGGKLQKGAGPCEREEALRRMHDPGHPWYGQKLWRAETYKAPNVLIQSAAAIQTKLWMRECWRAGIVPLLQMHDCLGLSVTSPETAEMVARLGEEVLKLEVPMKVDVHFGRNWGDAKHSWAELHAGAEPHVEPVVELAGEPERTRREGPKFSNDFDKPSNPLPWEDINSNDENLVVPPAHEIDWAAALEREFPRGGADADTFIKASPQPPLLNDDEYIRTRLAEEGIQSPPVTASPQQEPAQQPSTGNGHGDGFDEFTTAIDYSGNGARPPRGSKTEATRDTYAEEHAGEPFNDNNLRRQGYRLAQVFDYTLADGTLINQQNRYELKAGIAPTEKRRSKRFLAHHKVNGKDIFGAGDRRVIYNWPAIMRAGPGSVVFVPEGENKAKALIDAGLLATTVLSHKWTPECVAALTGYHVIILADHDKDGERLANDAQRKLAPIAASIRIVSAAHLWKHLPGGKEPKPGDDIIDWVARGGDVKRLLNICREIPADGLLASICATDVEIEDYDWVWPGRFALKKIGLIVGLPDEGKGLVFSDIAARITRGDRWPCGEGQAPLGNVIMLSAEDDVADTIVPRLKAAGADCTRVHILKMIREGGNERMFSLVSDLNALRRKIIEIGDVKVVMIDPITAYLGVGKVDSFRATDVRAILSPLKVLAEELHVAIIGIMHFNKKTDITSVLLRISDSLAYGAAARHVYGVVNDPDNFRRLFVKGKNNLARFEQPTLAFGIDEREVGADKRTGNSIRRPFIVWHDEPVDITATEALSAAAQSKSPSARDDAKQFLKIFLSNGPVDSTETKTAAKENGISLATLRRAQRDLHIDVQHDGPIDAKGDRSWRWHLPKSEGEDDDN